MQLDHAPLFAPSWENTIAPHQTLGFMANPAGFREMARSISGDYSVADFKGKFSAWLEEEQGKLLADASWLAKGAEYLGLDWTEKQIDAYVKGRDVVRSQFMAAGEHLLIAYLDTLWHPRVNATLVKSKSLDIMERAMMTAELLAQMLDTKCTAALWYYLGQAHHDYINRRRDGGLITDGYVGDAILYTILAFAVVPGTAAQASDGSDAKDPIEAWQSPEVQTFWAMAGRLMGYGGPLWETFEEAATLFRNQMKLVAMTENKQCMNEAMLAVVPSNRVKQF